MKNYKDKIGYVYCILLIIISIFIIGRTEIISKQLLYEIRNEVIPFADNQEYKGDDIMDEIFPSMYYAEDYGTYYYELGTADQTGGDDIIDYNTNSFDYVSSTEDNSADVVQDTESTTEVQDKETQEATTEQQVAVTNIPAVSNVGITYSMEQLMDFEFLMSNCYIVDGATSVTQDELDAETLLSMDMSLDLTGDDYKVLIYHTHGSETFADSRPGVTEDTVIGVGDELARILEEDYGIKVYHDRNVYDMVDGELDRSYAYTLSGNAVDKILAEYPSIEVVLDVHRDGVRDDLRLVKVVDGKPTAQIMFFNGVSRLNEEGDLGYLYNPNKIANLAFSLQMHLKGKEMYGDLMRKIYIGGYCFNLDRKPRASLIEVGAQTNTVEEAKNAMTPLAAIIYSVLSGN